MTRYYFHITNGTRTVRDFEGVELSDLRAAHNHALADARNLMQRVQSVGPDWSRWMVEITNELGAYALTVPFAGAGTVRQTGIEARAA